MKFFFWSRTLLRHIKILCCLLFTVLLFTAGSFAAEPKRENIEWLDIWVTRGGNPQAAPRVLLIGDSITRAYYAEAAKQLGDKVVCDRLATAASLGDPWLPQQVELLLKQYKYDVIHVNNGMHGWAYTEAEYAAAIPGLLKLLKEHAPQAKLIWATTTPTGGTNDKNPRVLERNKLVRAALAADKIPINDLHAVIAADPKLISKDGVHMTPAGTTALATQVAKMIQAVLKE
jgi:hypothetical protein